MVKREEIKKTNKEENWLDQVMEKQRLDLEKEEEILSSLPNRIKHKWIDIDDD